MTNRVRAIAAGVLMLALAACGGGGSDSPSAAPSPTTAGANAAGPSVDITYPPADEPVRGKDVLVALTVRAFELTEDRGETTDGSGHLVYYLDVRSLPTGDDATDVPKGAGRAESSAKTSHTWKDVAPGRHVLGVQLVTADDAPLDPPATDTVEIVVAA